MTGYFKSLLIIIAAGIPLRSVQAYPEDNGEVTVDAIVASVDGKPITLSDISARLPHARRLTMQEAANDEEARVALDGLILEELIANEAENRKIGVSDGEVKQYIEEVAKRNNLSLPDFEKALKNEGKTLPEYQHFVKTEILKSKLLSALARSGLGISEDDVDAYLKDHPELAAAGNKVKLAQILITAQNRSEEEAKQLAQDLHQKLVAGEDFAGAAAEHSDSPEAKDGGLLGIVAEKDLSSGVFDAVFSLKAGEMSNVIQSPAGFHIFKVVERYTNDEQNKENLRAEVRKTLLQQKVQNKMSSFLTTELYKQHSVDKKI